MRKTDLIARLGGDEFAVLMEEFADERDPIRTAERIHQAIIQPFYLDENEVFTTTSVGIATGQPDYKEAEDIVRDADLMPEFKRLGLQLFIRHHDIVGVYTNSLLSSLSVFDILKNGILVNF